MDEIREGIRLMVAAKEFPTNSGPIDVLAFDPTGEIYIIESKLYRNPDKRQVLAQALDYGASLWHGYTSGEKFTADIRAAFRRVSNEPLEEEIRATFGLDDGEVQELRQSTPRTNLGAGSSSLLSLWIEWMIG